MPKITLNGKTFETIETTEVQTKSCDFSKLLGKKFTKVERFDDYLKFSTNIETYYLMHEQECCETVYLEDICGDLQDLLNSAITLSEEVHNDRDETDFSWHFYRIGTSKGMVTITFRGTSDSGCYSEQADLYEEKEVIVERYPKEYYTELLKTQKKGGGKWGGITCFQKLTDEFICNYTGLIDEEE